MPQGTQKVTTAIINKLNFTFLTAALVKTSVPTDSLQALAARIAFVGLQQSYLVKLCLNFF